jgi:hypothetical protein
MRVRLGESELLLEGRPYGIVPLEEGAGGGVANCDATLAADRERYGLNLSRLVYGSWNMVR